MVFPKIAGTIALFENSQISADRRAILQPMVDHMKMAVNGGKPVSLNFICTHNSRRSHLAQVWAQVMAAHFGIDHVSCYSGGTESTAVFPEVLLALKHAGFEITAISEGSNTVHAIKFAANAHPIIGFSKKFDHSFNPTSGFVAIMTCTEANEACPFVPGAAHRMAIPYEDPKRYDNTPEQAEQYISRSFQIASEMHYIFSPIGKKS